MAQRTGANFKASVAAQFPTNGVGLISASRVVSYLGDDIADSFLNILDHLINSNSFAGALATNVNSALGTKTYIDNQLAASLASLSWKQSVKAATTANITLSGAQTVDGVSLIAGDRCLVKNQSTGSQNGIYVVASGSWTRATDNDSTAEMQNAVVSVDEGSTNADTTWRQSADAVTVGSTTVTWVSFGAGISGSTGSTDNALLRADGTGGSTLQSSAVSVDDNGDVSFGLSGTGGTTRNLNAVGSGANINIAINAKGTGAAQLVAGSNGFSALSSGNVVSGETTFTSAIVPALVKYTLNTMAQITANQNNYNINNGTFQRLSSDASRNITGIAGGAQGKIHILINHGSFNIVFTNNDAASSAANRMVFSTGANLTLAPNGSLTLIYDSTSSVWRDIAFR
jgi:hypothetical protein